MKSLATIMSCAVILGGCKTSSGGNNNSSVASSSQTATQSSDDASSAIKKLSCVEDAFQIPNPMGFDREIDYLISLKIGTDRHACAKEIESIKLSDGSPNAEGEVVITDYAINNNDQNRVVFTAYPRSVVEKAIKTMNQMSCIDKTKPMAAIKPVEGRGNFSSLFIVHENQGSQCFNQIMKENLGLYFLMGTDFGVSSYGGTYDPSSVAKWLRKFN